MNKFMVFAGIDYEALGGWRDFVDSYASIDEAKKCAELLFDNVGERDCDIYICPEHGKTKLTIRPRNYRADWVHVVDVETGTVVMLDSPKSWCRNCEAKPEWPTWYEMKDAA